MLSWTWDVHGFIVKPVSPRMTPVLQMSTTETDNPRIGGFGYELDNGTRKSHSMAENTKFVTGFFKGLSTKDSYASLLTSLYFVYLAMETCFDETKEETVTALDCKELRRLESLRCDLDYFYGPEWEARVKPSQATIEYVARIQHVAENKPYLLVAHQYTRYLGDLFGGQQMSGMATRSLKLEEGEGSAFYKFDEIKNVKEFINDYYLELNQLDLTEVQKQEIIDEANLVFAFNIDIFEELDGSALGAVWTILFQSMKEKLGFKS